MAMNLKYYGEFVSRSNTRYRIEIHSEEVVASQEVFFPADEPLVIEWNATDKITPIQPSMATLRLLSQSDRQFVDMYRIEVGAVLLTIYRNGTLYWRGTLDTEIYEEPYSYKTDYIVTLNFTDFGVLGRLNYSATTRCISVQTVIEQCLKESQILTQSELATRIIKHVSTTNPTCGYSSADVDDIFGLLINSENFLDKDSESMLYQDVLTAVLQPFALHIVQKAGHVYIFDINALSGLPAENVNWMSDDALLSADKVYNNVKINFSPLDEPKIIRGEVKEDETLSSLIGPLTYYDYHKDSRGNCDSGEGFRLHRSATLKSNIVLGTDVEFFQVCPIFSGKKETGVFWGCRSGDFQLSTNPNAIISGNAPCGAFYNNNDNSSCTSRMIMKLPRKLLNYTSIDMGKYSLRINLKLLFDVRYNPYESASDYNEKGNWSKLQDWTNQAYVPFRLVLYSANGIALMHYENKQMLKSNNYTNRSTFCKWVQGEGAWGDAFLAYYDWKDRRSASGCGGWQDNKPIIGYYRGELPSVWDKREAGEFIDLPPVGGYLELQIGSGVHQFDYNREVRDIYSRIRWVMYQEPAVTLCYKNGIEVEGCDVEDAAFLNINAKEDLTVDTILGTPPGRFGLPAAKGLLLSPTFYALSECTRAGVTDRLERLLIGTIYSQYASRKNILSGTAELLSDFTVLGDRSTQGKFMLLGEVQNVAADESEITMVEITADNYQGIEFKED